MKRFPILALALLILLLAACSTRDDPDPDPSPSPTPSVTASPSASPSASVSPTAQPPSTPNPTPPSSPAACVPASGGADGTDVNLVAVRVGSHPGYDRITFEFAPPQAPSPANTLPKYSVTKVDRITQDGSGDPVQVGGAALYSLVMHGASGVELDGGPELVITYKGPNEFKPNFPVLTELERSGDFENVLSWGIGLKAPRCIKASQLNSPLRLVLDIPHS